MSRRTQQNKVVGVYCDDPKVVHCIETVYFIRDGEFVKIGKASEKYREGITSRFTNIQCGNPRKIKLIGYFRLLGTGIRAHDLEQALHFEHMKDHVRGEWFRLTDQQIEDDFTSEWTKERVEYDLGGRWYYKTTQWKMPNYLDAKKKEQEETA